MSSPASALMLPEAPALRVMESLPAPMLSVPAAAEMVAVSTPSSILMVSKPENVAPSRVPPFVEEILSVLPIAPV